MPLPSHLITTLSAVADRIVPGEEGTPGASAAGADTAVQCLLDTDLVSLRDDYVLFLTQLDIESQVAFGTSFAALDTEKQDMLLSTFQSSAFFRLLVEHVQEQFWASPLGSALAGFGVDR